MATGKGRWRRRSYVQLEVDGGEVRVCNLRVADENDEGMGTEVVSRRDLLGSEVMFEDLSDDEVDVRAEGGN